MYKVPRTNLKQFKGGVKSSPGKLSRSLGPVYSKEVASIGRPLLGKSAGKPQAKSFKTLMSQTYGKSKIV